MTNRKVHKYYIGLELGNLTLLAFDNSNWSAKCSCGKIITVSSRHLYRKVSCGCLSKSNRFTEQDKLTTLINVKINHYKSGATRRNLEFKLETADFKKLVMQKCSYCKFPPHLEHKYKNFKIKLNGIDRINSSLGYTKQNCTSCCSMCNRAKSNLSEYEFKEWLKWVKDNV